MKPGLGNSAAYQFAGFPFITQSHITASLGYHKITFPSVAKSVRIDNIDAARVYPYNSMTGSCPLVVFFGVDLTGTYPPDQETKRHAISIPISGSFVFDGICTQIFIGKEVPANFGAYQLYAQITNIEYTELYSGTTRDGWIQGPGINQ